VRLTRCDVRDHINYRKNRPLAFVLILQNLTAAEIANMRRLRDFRSPAIFEFFNTIGAKLSFRKRSGSSCAGLCTQI
jgi:hypothetical protein